MLLKSQHKTRKFGTSNGFNNHKAKELKRDFIWLDVVYKAKNTIKQQKQRSIFRITNNSLKHLALQRATKQRSKTLGNADIQQVKVSHKNRW